MLEQLEAAGGRLGENGSSAMAERRRHRRLAARLDVHGAQAPASRPARRARARRAAAPRARRAPARPRQPAPRRVALARGALRCSSGRRACAAARADPRPPRAASRRARARCEGGREHRRRPRSRRPRRRAPLRRARARRAASPDAHRPRPRAASSCARRARASRHARRQLLEIECGQAGTQAAELLAELLRALGGARLERERTQPLLHLSLEVARTLHLLRDARELQLRAVAAALEPSQAGRFLDEGAPLARRRGQDRLHLPLPDDGRRARAEADVGKELDDVRPAHGRSVDEVLPFAAAVETARDRDLLEVDARAGRRQRPRSAARPRSTRRAGDRPSPRRARHPASPRGARSAPGSRRPRAVRRRRSTSPIRSARRRPPRRARGALRPALGTT